MEGLLIIVAELLLLPFIAGITAFCEIVLTLASLVLQLFFGIAFKQSEESKERKFRLSPALIKWVQRVTIGSLALFASALLAINFLFFEDTVRFAADKVEAKTGFAIQYEAVEGNIFSGSFALTGLDLRQTQADKPQLTVEAQDISANLSVWRFISGSRVIESATVSQAKVHLQTLPKEKEERKGIGFALSFKDKGLDALNISKSPLLKSPIFVVKDLKLTDLSIQVYDHSADTPTQYNIQIDRFQAQPLRSHFVAFDLLFRSNLAGTLNGSRLEIVNTEVDGRRHTQWTTSQVPAASLASLVGGPFRLFEAGTVDVEVTDQWDAEDRDNLDLNWKIRVIDAQARLPEGTPKLLQPLAQVWVDNINQSEEDWEFSFQLQLSEDQFYGTSSLNAQQIWSDSIPVFLKQASEISGVEESTVKEKTSKALNAVKGFLEKRKNESGE